MAIFEVPEFPGFVFYALYWKKNNEERVWVTNAEAKKEVERRRNVSVAILDYVFSVGVVGGIGAGISFSTGFLEELGMEAAAFLAGLTA